MAMQFRGDTAANIATAAPYLRMGEPLIETDTGELYLGDGLHNTDDLLPLEPRDGVITIGHETLAVDTAQVDITVPDRDDLVKVEIWIRTRGSIAGSRFNVHARFNSIASAHYDDQKLYGAAASLVGVANRAGSSLIVGAVPGAAAEANQWSSVIIEIPFPRKVGPWRTVSSRNGHAYGTASGNVEVSTSNAWLRKGFKIDTVSLFLASGSMIAATQILTLGYLER